jgi:hypothetical protein
MPINAKVRAQLALRATTRLQPGDALGLVRSATNVIRGGGASLLTSGLQNMGAQVHVERESAGTIALSITSGKRLIELCTFSARAATGQDGTTTLRVGGLETYRTSQARYAFIPIGPKSIAGYDPYRRFLDHVAQAIAAQDPHAVVSVQTPS